MINYKYSPEHVWVDSLSRPWRVGDIGMNKDRSYIFTINNINNTDADVSWYREYKTESPKPHCSGCAASSCPSKLGFSDYRDTTLRTDLWWLVRPKKTILILNKEQYA